MFGFGIFKVLGLGVSENKPVGNWEGKLLKPINFDIETVLGFVLGTCMRCYKHKLILYSINILKQILRYIIKYIRSMPCYFVSNGIEMAMTDETFDFIWNGFGNRELTDSETSSSEESYKANSSVNKNTNAEWRKQDDGYYNRKPNDETYFQRYYQEKTKQPCVCDICGSAMSCKSNLAKHKKTKKCQRFLV